MFSKIRKNIFQQPNKVKKEEVIYKKIVIVGNSGIGKSRSIYSFLGCISKPQYPTTGVEVHIWKEKNDSFSIWDCSGYLHTMGITDFYYSQCDICIICKGRCGIDGDREKEEWKNKVALKSPNATFYYCNPQEIENVIRNL